MISRYRGWFYWAIALALWTGAVVRAGTTVRSKSSAGGAAFAANISHPPGVNPSMIVFSRALASSWSDQLFVTELRETTDYNILLVATTTQNYDGINYRQMDRSFTYGSNAPELAHLDIYNIDNIPAGISHSSDQAHWTGHLERTRLFDLFGTMIGSTDTASFGLDRIRSGDGNIFDYNSDPFNPPVVFSSYSLPESVSLTGEAAKAKIAEWSDSHLVFDIYHDFNFPETLTSREYSFFSDASSSPKTALMLAQDWDARTPFSDFAGLSFDDSNDPVAFVLSPTADRKSVEKIQYKIVRGPNSPAAVTWLELFSPKDPTHESSFIVRSWISDATNPESSVYTVDPLGIDPADDHAQSRRPEDDGKWELVFLEPSAGVDTNHDGSISGDGMDDASAEQPYFHAPNFNHDGGSTAADAEDGVVNSAADLADFFPVYLDLKGILEFLPPGSGVTYRLRQADNALNFVYTNLTRATAFGYLTDNAGTGYGPGLMQPAMTASTIQITSAGIDLFGGTTGSPAFLDAIQNHEGGVILVEGRTFTSQPLVVEVSQADQNIMEFTLFAKISLGEIAVDANRDGVIKFASEDSSDATIAARPYRFWLNDDIDRFVADGNYGQLEDDDLDPLDPTTNIVAANGWQPDWTNNQITSRRDLEDFSRLWINLHGIADAVRNGQLYIGLRWSNTTGDPWIKLYPHVENDGGTKYLFDSTGGVPLIQFSTTNALADLRTGSTVTIVAPEGGTFVFPNSVFADRTESAPVVPLLFEGCKVGAGQLQIVILKKEGTTYTEIGQGLGMWLDLKEPKEFIQRWSSGDGDRAVPQPWVRLNANSGTFTSPATDTEKDLVLYVHGYNMTGGANLTGDKQRWIETTYKRLYWLGYKGRVAGYSWPCAIQGLFIAGTSILGGVTDNKGFDDSELRAWQSGTYLMQLLSSLKTAGYRVHLLAHSQGNIVAGEALLLWKSLGNTTPLVSTYIASQGAIPAHCYDATVSIRLDFTPEVPNLYGRFWMSGDSATLPATWGVNNPSYLAAGKIANAATQWANFYNPDDYALTGNAFTGSDHPGWLLDQKFKPDVTYGYTSSNGFNVGHVPLQFPDDQYQIFSYAAPAWSLALGATSTGGVFNQNAVDLKTSFAFSREHLWHSAEFRSYNAARSPYWAQLLRTIGIQPITP